MDSERQQVEDIRSHHHAADLVHAQAWIDADTLPTPEQEDAEFFEQDDAEFFEQEGPPE